MACSTLSYDYEVNEGRGVRTCNVKPKTLDRNPGSGDELKAKQEKLAPDVTPLHGNQDNESTYFSRRVEPTILWGDVSNSFGGGSAKICL